MFADDRDLLVLEPHLFGDVAWASQRLLRTTGELAGGVLTIDDGDFDASGVSQGSVVRVGETAVEVVSISDAQSAVVSLARPSRDDTPLAPEDAPQSTVLVGTFRPQIAIVHEQVMRMLASGAHDVLPSSAVLDVAPVRLLEALGALHLIFSGASTLAGPGSPTAARAREYAHRYEQARRGMRVRVDTDGDGVADGVRWPNVIQLVRG